MGTVHGTRRKRKRKKRLREVRVVSREEYGEMELSAKVELIRQLIPLGLMHVHDTLQEEVRALCGARHERKAGRAGWRHGWNPGSVRIAGQRVGIRVPRVRGESSEIPLQSYSEFSGGSGEMDELLMRRIVYGISCRNYEQAAETIPGAIGLSSSTVSRSFVKASAAQLKAFQERELGSESYVALFLDGKTFANDTMVIALGVAEDGTKRFLGFVETGTENERVVSEFLGSLMDRGLDVSQGLLVVMDGAKGLRAAVRKVFGKRGVVQRCTWHKRENVVNYLPEEQQTRWRQRLRQAYDRPTYTEASTALEKLHGELESINQSAANSLLEGMEETLTLHRLGVYPLIGLSFKTTNCIESVNSLIEERCGKVDAWRNSNQKHRWLAAALLNIEPRLRRVKGFRHLPKLRRALQGEINETNKPKAA
jgi:putative transposase